jgi:hypothetical protein
MRMLRSGVLAIKAGTWGFSRELLYAKNIVKTIHRVVIHTSAKVIHPIRIVSL